MRISESESGSYQPSDRLIGQFYERIWKNPNTGCWNWLGPAADSGEGWHGQMSAKGFSWRLAARAAPGSGQTLVHRCRRRSCVNPDHLVVMGQLEFTERGYAGVEPLPGDGGAA